MSKFQNWKKSIVKLNFFQLLGGDIVDIVYYREQDVLFYSKSDGKVMKLQNSEISFFSKFYKLPWIGTTFAKDSKNSRLAVQTGLKKITIFEEIFSTQPKIFLEVTPPKGNIFNFLLIQKNILFIATKDGYLYFFKIEKNQKMLISQNWIKSFISSSSVCHLGSHIAISTSNNFGKLEKLQIWKLTKNFEMVLPRVLSYRQSPLAQNSYSYINSLKLGYIRGNLVVIGCQLNGGALMVYSVTQEKIVKLTVQKKFIDGIFCKFGFFRETTWVLGSTGGLKRLIFEI